MRVSAKICGLRTAESVAAAVSGGADFVGFVFYPPSPRNLSIDEAAALAAAVPDRVTVTALTVDADDALIAEIVHRLRPGLLQLHGGEPPERVAGLRRTHGIPVMKAIKVAAEDDLALVPAYAPVADRLLFDAKPPPSMTGALPGGNALSFEWSLLSGRKIPLPWMLSGGLDAENVAAAVKATGARAVDVSSGVERRPGEKDPARIAAFLAAVAEL